ncbi:peptidylprolyl isomerase [Paramuribaculum intestinale]|uniref:peptidylprolyl isomerase n=1 Tax=Paramuribaculum intestinale TaxID=2094151 RepID=UPI0025A9B156|nr:SurA N-terminal domain-containing protein [Paramuribaculum intestinale]
MATLEKIRSKSVLLLVIIGVALLAFIIGDFFTSGRTFFGTGTTVAKVGGQKIDIQEFQRQMEVANQSAQQSGQKIDQALLQQQVLGNMVSEKLYKEELEALGLKVTDDELTEMMLGTGAPMVDQMVRQQVGVESASALHDMAFNPVKYGLDEQTAMQLRNLWINLENQMEQYLLQQKFQTLFTGTLVANKLDAKALYDEGLGTATVAYAHKDYTSLADEDFEVSDAEIKAAWNERRELFAIAEEKRRISYIDVDIQPSQADLVAAEKTVEEAIASLRNTPDTEGVAGNNLFVVDRSKTTAAAIRNSQVRAFADSAAVGSTALVARIGNDFTLAKLIGKSTEIDSINCNIFVVTAGRSAADSIIGQLNSGATTFEALSQNPDVAQPQADVKLSLTDPQLAQFKKALSDAPAGRYFMPDTLNPQNVLVVRVNSRQNPVTVYDLATIEYRAEPSNATINRLQASLQAFLNANTTAAEFNKNAADSGYTAIPATVSPSTPQIGRLNDTRGTVNWAMNAKKGAVSPIFGDEATGRFLAVALDDIYDDYVPANDPQTRAYLAEEVRNDKKAQKLISDYQGKASDLAGYAQIMNSRIDSVMVNFSQFSIYTPALGGPEMIAEVSCSEPGKLTGPVKTDNGVVVFNVVNVDNNGRPYSFDESATLFQRTRGAAALGNQIAAILLGKRKVENNILKFFRD